MINYEYENNHIKIFIRRNMTIYNKFSLLKETCVNY